ncbi:hypothetical protein MMC06_005731 [Schaereria dolodes]|nr:hypothetical protein [Schaereria dolodes]
MVTADKKQVLQMPFSRGAETPFFSRITTSSSSGDDDMGSIIGATTRIKIFQNANRNEYQKNAWRVSHPIAPQFFKDKCLKEPETLLESNMRGLLAAIVLAFSAGYLSLYQTGITHQFPAVTLTTPKNALLRSSTKSSSISSSDQSRTISLHESSGDIHGSLQLLDSIRLRTSSGDIYVSVSLGPATENRDKPADFVACTTSGDINTMFPSSAQQFPSRDFYVNVKSTSGDIRGTYPLGQGYLKSTSGDMSVALVLIDGNTPARLTAETMSGTQRIFVSSETDAALMKSMVLRAKSMSGDITLRCSKDFEGTISVQTASGDISIDGKGIELIKDERRRGWRYFEASKGNGRGSIQLSNMSGNVNLAFG